MSYQLLTDVTNAERLVRRHGADLRYCYQLDQWFVWDGRRWRVDDSGEVVRRAKESARSMLADAANVEDAGHRKRLIEHAEASERCGAIEAAIKLARSEPGIPISPDDLDADPMLFGCANGTLDLRTGQLRPARREDYITITSPVAFDLDAECPTFRAFMNRIMGENADLIGYLQRVAGLFLTADISVQELFIFFGGGANGKSVFIDAILYILGDYAAPAPDSLLTVRSHDEHPTEIANLQNRRLIVASETESGARLKEQTVKKLTGDDVLTGRRMRQDFITFRRTHKTVMVTNHAPRITDTGNAIWRRIRMIPFGVTIPLDQQDRKLLDKLKGEAAGILSWAAAGCLLWQQTGMDPPAEVLIATENYRAESDPLTDYLADRCVRGERVRVVRGELYEDYRSWAFQTGDKHPLEARAFYAQIRKVQGVSDDQWRPVGSATPARGFTGIGLASVGCATVEDNS